MSTFSSTSTLKILTVILSVSVVSVHAGLFQCCIIHRTLDVVKECRIFNVHIWSSSSTTTTTSTSLWILKLWLIWSIIGVVIQKQNKQKKIYETPGMAKKLVFSICHFVCQLLWSFIPSVSPQSAPHTPPISVSLLPPPHTLLSIPSVERLWCFLFLSARFVWPRPTGYI